MLRRKPAPEQTSQISDKDDGTTARTDEENAKVLNDFFQSVFTEEPEGEQPEAPVIEFTNPLTDIEIDVVEVKKLLKIPPK